MQATRRVMDMQDRHITPRNCAFARVTLLAIATTAGCATSVEATTVRHYTESDAASWYQASGNATNVDFQSLPVGTAVLNQFSSVGMRVVGMPTLPAVTVVNWPTSPHGGIAASFYGQAYITFDQPQYAFAFTHAYVATVRLLYHGEYVGGSTSSGWGAFPDRFDGWTSDQPFDMVHIYGVNNGDNIGDRVVLDNLLFSTVPSPAALAPVAIAGLGARRRRPA